MKRLASLILAAAAAVVAGCASQSPSAIGVLAGTSWELIRFQSMDDAQGTTRIADPTLYTVTFGADGSASFRLDCNLARGTWQASPATDGLSGRLSFGPLAGTRALCPPPSMDEKLIMDLGYVRGYLLRDGYLHMSLMADAGIYSWRPMRR
ncbi:META domain-containing protein [Burkholderiaceae bacterium FT117]|uniref:META domain-containing protein n=1 Tax=Zeimonas sediminis TaxID=2944268 RepID=UPI0023431AB3|nr:META domain-containing protein [Zeimonas sediminis]MCM5570091.1 META domain-containing protein [Zeimonas sediminis]